MDYTPESNSFIRSTILSPTELLLTTAISCEQGDGVILRINDFEFKNIIDNIDSTKQKIILTNDILDKDGNILENGTIEIKIDSKYIIKLNNIEEGNYLIKPTNTKLIVRKSWVQPYVSLQDLSTKLIDAGNLKESRLARLNKIALKFLYSDLSGFGNYYDIIDEINLWKLLYYKIECLLSSDYEENNVSNQENRSCYKYDNALNNYRPKEKFTEGIDGKPTKFIEENLNIGGWSL